MSVTAKIKLPNIVNNCILYCLSSSLLLSSNRLFILSFSHFTYLSLYSFWYSQNSFIVYSMMCSKPPSFTSVYIFRDSASYTSSLYNMHLRGSFSCNGLLADSNNTEVCIAVLLPRSESKKLASYPWTTTNVFRF